MGAGEFALNCALRVLQGWRFPLDNSTPAMFAMRIVAVNRHVRGKRNDIGKGSARPVCAGRDEVRIESVGRTRSRQESLTRRLQLHKGGRSEILQGTAHSNVDGSGTVAAYHLAGSCRKHEWSSYSRERNRQRVDRWRVRSRTDYGSAKSQRCGCDGTGWVRTGLRAIPGAPAKSPSVPRTGNRWTGALTPEQPCCFSTQTCCGGHVLQREAVRLEPA